MKVCVSEMILLAKGTGHVTKAGCSDLMSPVKSKCILRVSESQKELQQWMIQETVGERDGGRKWEKKREECGERWMKGDEDKDGGRKDG